MTTNGRSLGRKHQQNDKNMTKGTVGASLVVLSISSHTSQKLTLNKRRILSVSLFPEDCRDDVQ